MRHGFFIAVLPLWVACKSTPDENTGPPDETPEIETPDDGAKIYVLDTTAQTTNLIFTGVGTTGPQSGTWNSWNVQAAQPLSEDGEEPDGLDGLQIELVVDATTISTSVNQLTDHLRTNDFFDVDNYPEAGFESSSVTLISGNRYQVVGKMTLRGTTREHAFEATIDDLGEALHTTAEMVFSRFDFGLHDGSGTGPSSVKPGDDKVTLSYDVTLVEVGND